MDYQQRQGTDSASFARIWNRVSTANGGRQIEVQKPEAHSESTSQRQDDFIPQRIRAELVDHHTCARLVNNSFSGQMMRAITEDELFQARRLSTANVLITGKWFFPIREATPLSFRNWHDGMRTAFLRARKAAEEYHCAAEKSDDPSPQELFNHLAEDENLHALRIRTALEHWG